MRNRIKARLAELGLRSQDLIKELREIGINCTPPEQTIPNLFFLKSAFGIIVKIPGKG